MPIINHTKEIKIRTFYSLFSFVICLLFCFLYSEEIVYVYSKPILELTGTEYIATSYTESFLSYMKISIMISIYSFIISMIINFIIFISPALYKREFIFLVCFLAMLIFILFIGYYFAFNYILPGIYRYLFNFSVLDINKIIHIQYFIKITDYLFQITSFTSIISLLFLIFPLIFILCKYEFIYLESLSIYRSYMYVFILFISFFNLNPDIITSIYIFILLLFLYEMTLLVIYIYIIYYYFKYR